MTAMSPCEPTVAHHRRTSARQGTWSHRADFIAGTAAKRIGGNVLDLSLDQPNVALRLIHIPTFDGVSPNLFDIGLRPRRKHVMHHDAEFSSARLRAMNASKSNGV